MTDDIIGAVSVLRGVAVNEATPFTLHSGDRSSVRFDVMRMLRDRDAREYILRSMSNEIRKLQRGAWRSVRGVDVLVGIPTGGAVLAALLVDGMTMEEGKVSPLFSTPPTLLIEHNPVEVAGYISNLIATAEGVYVHVLLIDDVVTTGASIDNYRQILSVLPGVDVDVICAIDRRSLRSS